MEEQEENSCGAWISEHVVYVDNILWVFTTLPHPAIPLFRFSRRNGTQPHLQSNLRSKVISAYS